MEIKFRGMAHDGRWVYGSYVVLKHIHPAIYFEVGKGGIKRMDLVCIKSETVGQYTGLKDKNGVEIYLGDIVNVITTPASPYEENFLSVVYFNDGCFHVKDKRDTTELCLSVFTFEASNGYKALRIEVIGNIHQNSDLLNDQLPIKRKKEK